MLLGSRAHVHTAVTKRPEWKVSVILLLALLCLCAPATLPHRVPFSQHKTSSKGIDLDFTHSHNQITLKRSSATSPCLRRGVSTPEAVRSLECFISFRVSDDDVSERSCSRQLTSLHC